MLRTHDTLTCLLTFGHLLLNHVYNFEWILVAYLGHVMIQITFMIVWIQRLKLILFAVLSAVDYRHNLNLTTGVGIMAEIFPVERVYKVRCSNTDHCKSDNFVLLSNIEVLYPPIQIGPSHEGRTHYFVRCPVCGHTTDVRTELTKEDIHSLENRQRELAELNNYDRWR